VVLNSTCNWQKEIDNALKQTKDLGKPVALLIEKGTFDKYTLQKVESPTALMRREEAIEAIVEQLDDKSVIVSTTGMTSRELFEIRERRNESHNKDFLTVGGMGHTSQIAMGVAIGCPNIKVYCLDGDGSVIMHMGALAISGTRNQRNFYHIVLNNNAHDSVGGQPTVADKINIAEIARNCGYSKVFKCSDKVELKKIMSELSDLDGPLFLEVKVSKGARSDLGRPTTTPKKNKEELMRYLQS
jgi:phosphonopyruvate decarboxylase